MKGHGPVIALGALVAASTAWLSFLLIARTDTIMNNAATYARNQERAR